jgi:DNA repair ATPase RecN
LVWKNYDINNQLVESDWQRCESFEDVQRKCLELRDENVRLERLNKIKKKYLDVTGSVEHYEKEFEKRLKEIVDG